MKTYLTGICSWLAAVLIGTAMNVKIGDSKESVINSLGKPKSFVASGAREVLLYDAVRIIVLNGKVKEVNVLSKKVKPQIPDTANYQKDLVLHYLFDEVDGIVRDHSGHGSMGKAHNAVPSKKQRGAYEFNGNSAFMQVTPDIALVPPYTVTAWVYLRRRLEDGGEFPFYSGRTILARGDLNRSGQWDYIFNVNAHGKLGFVTHATFSRADTLQNPKVFPLNQWVFVAFTHAAMTGQLYQDGHLVGANANMAAGNTHRKPGTFIGKIYNTRPAARGDHFWDGMIDELCIYKRALPEAAVKQIFAAGRTENKPPLVTVCPARDRDEQLAAPPIVTNAPPAPSVRQLPPREPTDQTTPAGSNIFIAAKSGDVATVQALLKKSTNVNTKDKYGITPLMYAARNGHHDMVKALLADGADLHAKDEDGRPVLIDAAKGGHLAVVEMLLAKGAKLNGKDDFGWTALMEAVRDGRTEMVRALVARGTDVNTRALNDWTALLDAAQKGRTTIVEMLLAGGGHVETQDDFGETALVWAAREEHTDTVRALLAGGANANAQSRHGEPVLIKAVSYGPVAIVEALLAAGADVNIKGKDGETALWHATRRDRSASVRLLKQAGATK